MTPVLMLMMMVQVLAGTAIALGGLAMVAVGMDKKTPLRQRAAVCVLAAAGVWYAVEPIILGIPTSTKPGLLFAGLLGYALLCHGRRVRGLIEGEPWAEVRP